jgi:hypothetical protein
MRRVAIAAYSVFNSIPMNLRARRLAATPVVPEPANGSRTTQGCVDLFSHLQDNAQRRAESGCCAVKRLHLSPIMWQSLPVTSARTCERRLTCSRSSRATARRRRVLVTSRAHGVPHREQHPAALVPARMQSSASCCGNVAKCAPLNGRTGMCQFPPYSAPHVIARWGPGVFARMGATRFRAIGGHSFSPDREPGVSA